MTDDARLTDFLGEESESTDAEEAVDGDREPANDARATADARAEEADGAETRAEEADDVDARADDEEGAAALETADGDERDGDETVGGASESDAGDASTGTVSDVEPTTTTYGVRRERTCSICGETVERWWRHDGAVACCTCKEW